MQAAGLAARNGARIHITAFGDTAMSIRRDTCRHRLGQEDGTQQYQENDEDFSHYGTVPQEPTGEERPSEVPNFGKQRSCPLSHARRRNADDLWFHDLMLDKWVFFNRGCYLCLAEFDCQQHKAPSDEAGAFSSVRWVDEVT